MAAFKNPFTFSFLRISSFVVLLGLMCSSAVSAQSLTWNANTESTLAGYRVQYGTVSGSPSTTVDVGRVTSWRFSGLQAGATYYFRVVAYNTSGQTSAPSTQVSYTVPGTPPPTSSAPTLSSISPASGPTAGGTTITLTGTNFVSGATVRVGGVAATNVAFASSTRLTARTPAGAAGARDVVVTNPNGQAAARIGGFTYTTTSTALTATAVSPLSGSTSGGTAITVTGTGFVSGATISIGGTAATSVTYVSSTQLTARTPAKAAGGYSVVVRNPNGQTANTPVGFTYSGSSTPPPSGSTLTATAVSPTSGPRTGGTAITITGTGFVSGAAVLIGGTPATSVSVASSTRITARTPAKAPGGYTVQVRNPNGQIVNTPRGFLYTTSTSVQTTAAASTFSTTEALDATATIDGAAPDAALDSAIDSAVAEMASADALADTTQPSTLVTRYLAEGVENAQMHTRLAIANPEDGVAHVRLTFMTTAGAVTQQNLDVPARSRRTLDLSSVMQLSGTTFSTMVESDRAVAVDRRVSLDAAGRATTVAAAVDEASPTWFFAEAPTTAPFEQFYLVQNPTDTDTQVEVRYLPPGGAEPVVRTHAVAAHSRATIWVDREAPALAATNVGAEIASVDGTPIVVERTVYTTQDGSAQPRSAVTQAGVTSIDGPSDDSARGGARWLIADAQPGSVRQASSVVIANQGATTDVKVTLLFEDGRPVEPATFKVAADSRFAVPLAQAFPAAAGRNFSVLIEAADPAATLTVERAIARQTVDRTTAATGAAATGAADGPSTPATRLP